MFVVTSNSSITDGWVRTNLKCIATINYGKSPKEILSSFGNYPVVGTGGTERFGDKFLYDGDSIILGRKGTIDRVYFVSGRFWAIDTAYYLSDFKNALPRWLFYFLQSVDFRQLNEATGVPSLSRDLLYKIEVSKPSKTEQSKIAEILSTVDRAIEQTEGLIAKQQRIKTGLMQDLLTRGIDEHGNLRSEETHEFKDSPLRRIPVEWEVSRLSDLASVDRGKFTHRPRDDVRFYGGPFPFIQTGDVTSHVGRTVNSYTQTLSVKGTKVSKEFPKGTIAITIAANIADTAILGQPMFFPDSVVGSVVVEPYSIRYIELAIRRWKPTLERMAPQSAQRNINLEVLRPLLIATPSPNEQIQIAEIYERAESAHMQLEETHEKLCSLKTALMQDLLTGKVRVTPLLEKKEVQ